MNNGSIMKLTLCTALFAVALGIAAPTMAQTAKTAGDEPAPTSGQRHSPRAVTVTNQLTGEQGCHNRETQTSEPGACPTKDPGQ